MGGHEKSATIAAGTTHGSRRPPQDRAGEQSPGMVMRQGRISAAFSREEASEEKIMELATATDRATIEQVLPGLAAEAN